MSGSKNFYSDTVLLRNSLSHSKIRVFNIPFKMVFSRYFLQNRSEKGIILELENADGINGIGEVVPYYLHNRSISDITNTLKKLLPRLITFSYDSPETIDSSVNSLLTWYKKKSGEDSMFYTEKTLLTSTLLDLLSREKSKTFPEMFEPLKLHKIPLSGTITAKGRGIVLSMCHSLYENHIRNITVKMGSNLNNEFSILKNIISKYGDTIALTIDFRGLLPVEDSEKAISELMDMGIFKFQQPLPPAKRNEIVDLIVKFHGEADFILDDSIISTDDLTWFIENCPPSFININLAKNGGLFNCQRIIKMATESGWRAVLGSNIGETAFSSSLSSLLASIEDITGYNSIDNFKYLQNNVTNYDFQDNCSKGFYDIDIFKQNPGHGFEISENNLNLMTETIIENSFLL